MTSSSNPATLFLTKGGAVGAAFLFSLLAAAVLGSGSAVPLSQAALRVAVFSMALGALVTRRREALRAAPYLLGVCAFAVLALGHGFSSVYVWVSLQHAVNIAAAGVFLSLAFELFRERTGDLWRATLAVVAGLAVVQIGVALFQRFISGSARPRGTFDNPNFLAEFLAVAGVLFLARFLFGPGGTRRGRGAALAVFFIASGLVLSASRGVLVAVFPALAMLCMWRWRARRGAIIAVVVALPVLLAVGYAALGRFSFSDPYGYGRLAIWRAAWGTFLDNPLGVGLGGFKYFWPAAQSPFPDAFRHYGKQAVWAHNEYLEVLSGLGIVGFLLFATILAVPLLVAVRRREAIAAGDREIVAGSGAALVVSGVHAFVNPGFHNAGIFVLDGLLLGALIACLRHASPIVRPVALPRWLRVPAASAMVALLGVSLATYAATYAAETAGRMARDGRPDDAVRRLTLASAIDPLRASIADAGAGLEFRTYRGDFGKDAVAPRARLDRAIGREARARDLSPMDSLYAFRLAALTFERYRLVGRTADLQSAFSHVNEGLVLNPYSAEGLWQRAGMAASVGKNRDAARDLEAAVAREPNFCRGYGRLATLAGAEDPVAAARWRKMESDCLKDAPSHSDEVWENWFLTTEER